MDAVAQVANRKLYGRTNEVGRMLTSGQLAQAIRSAVKRGFERQEPDTNIFDLLPARAATSIRYDKGAKTATACDEGGKEEKIDLHLKEGWYKSDGNPFGVPNGAPSTKNDPDALYLYRHQGQSFSGPIGFGLSWGDEGRRNFDAYVGWSSDSGVALVGREAIAPLVEVPVEKLIGITNPRDLLERASRLESVAKDLSERFKECEGTETYTNLVTKTREDARVLRHLAEKLASILPKA